MPFTPFHFGVNALPGLASGNRFDLASLILANVAIDIEPLLAILVFPDMMLHGIGHTFLVGGAAGLAAGALVFAGRRWVRPLYRRAGLPARCGIAACLAGGLAGGLLHVTFDAFIYGEMQPFYPDRGNPLAGVLGYSGATILGAVGWVMAGGVYMLCARRNR
jgi:membrane-bound metal-dependent hydrolase YbcI (DUF457 family)